jgi:copper chaperone NosL
VLFVAFGVLAMIDFWKWEYAYGHNLNPNAPIIVPGMAYQPPLVGFKQLLNFGAYSMPAIGGWTFVVVGMLLMGAVMYEWKKARDRIIVVPAVKAAAMVFISLSMLTGCSSEPQAIRVGVDDCTFCKMKISDNRFGAEIVTTKGKVYKFDDAHCIQAFIKSAAVPNGQLGTVYFTTFNPPHDLVKVNEVKFLQSPYFKSPMNGNIAAFSSEEQLAKVIPEFNGNRISWEEMLK